ncbi:MAG: hypothetical protein V4629_02070 [Pseudomonadota bacterium]
MTLSIQSKAQALKTDTQFTQTEKTVLSRMNSIPKTLKLLGKVVVGFVGIRGAVADTDGYCGRLSSKAASIKLFTSAYDCAGVKESVENLLQDCSFFSDNKSKFTQAIPDFSVDVSGTKKRIENPHASLELSTREGQKPGAVKEANRCVNLALKGLGSIDKKMFPGTINIGNSIFQQGLTIANHQIVQVANNTDVQDLILKALPEEKPRPQIVHIDGSSKARTITFKAGNGFVNITNDENIPIVHGGTVHIHGKTQNMKDGHEATLSEGKIVKLIETSFNLQNITQHDEF